MRAFVERLPRGRMIEHDQRGRFMFVEDPERFARDVTAFLAQQGVAAPPSPLAAAGELGESKMRRHEERR